ncbi:DUF6445 family protein [Paraglaciecola hydrolytica]|uniref:Uncharacterized protein n=1 Tax=Paraglaciecola hydrolytica TaxID=1799789 RepID=A0A148KLB2_9ALTE|nr:DUF6445 family protein [Paraglaciecola hydrolytica]KXI27070.1 hypothetical protein AX660_01380 [Paraglaciecola hydrolytica]
MINPDNQVLHHLVGNEKQPVVVVDDFLQNADSLIDYALQSGGVAPARGFYPGIRSAAPQRYNEILLDFVGAHIAPYFSQSADSLKSCESYFSMVTTPVQQLSVFQSVPHFDRPAVTDIAAILYLCDEKHGGTSLYRHKKTGFEYINKQRLSGYLQTQQQEFQLEGQPRGYMNADSPCYERIMSVDAKFNRIVFYRCSSLHSGNIGHDYAFDTDPRTGRFTLTSFISGM